MQHTLSKYESLVDALQSLRVKFSSALVQPRGLVNSGNMCFMNVVLQALLYCAPFFNMLLDIRQNVAFSFNQPTPLLEALIQFTNEFKQDPTPMALLLEEDTDPFVPENVYEALRQKNVFQTLRGQQEDAQEFMSYLIDGISQEMADILQQHQHQQHRLSDRQNGDTGNEDGESEWQEVGPHNKASIVRDNSDSLVSTPITRIFGGTIRSTLTVPHSANAANMRGRHSGKNRPSSNREPFQWLALDISSDSVRSIEQALDEFVAPETIEGYTNVYGESVNATKQILLEKVPPVLVFHLKRFVFCHNEGVQKVHKFIQYPQELQLSPDWLTKSKATLEHRNARYRLESVIYHHGSQASGGHYTCDLRRSEKEWLRFDDIDITILHSVDKVLDEKKDRSAYILFYTICS
ncbi:hypothetical protein GGI15_000453 [Coemansia interrupta]|uniref:Ubiquitin carboxyl-terminal hydrolase n=1 Tax=Coemansia interrupta TaxID=1126814 RepID=A0A9W8HN50_9FUNG|nr:hypothetical protein GGI15_000453 [Coemansia interrupta]